MSDQGSARPRERAPGAIRRLFGETLQYGLGGTASQAALILLVPIYARVLGPAGVGVTAVINTTVSLAMMLTVLALPHAFFRWYFQQARHDRDRAGVVATSLTLRVLASAAGTLLLLGLVAPLVGTLYGSLDLLPVFALIVPILFFDSFAQAPLSFLRAERRPGPYLAISISRALIGAGLTVVLVVVLDFGIAGVVIGAAVAAGLTALAAAWLLWRGGAFRFGWDAALARDMVRFSLPLVPASVAAWALNLSDRYLLQAMTDASTVGVYALGYTGGLIVNALVVHPFSLAWGAAYWDIARRDDAPHVFARVLTAFAIASSGAALLLSALGTDAIRLLLGDAFEVSRFVVPFSAFAYVCYGLYVVASAGINLVSQTRWVPVLTGAAAAASVVLNLLLIPMLGLFGAALSTLVAYALLAVLAGWLALRYYPVPWEAWRVGSALAVAGALAAASLLGVDHIAWRLAMVAAYPIVLLAARILEPAELAKLGAVVLARRGG